MNLRKSENNDARGLPANRSRRRFLITWILLGSLVLLVGCAKYNTFYNAKRAFDDAEELRKERIRQHKDPGKPTGQQATNYEEAARKAQKVIDNYPGHSLTDDALFMQGKAYHRLESYRMSIRKFENLFLNYPATPFMEEALYLQALNYLLIGDADRSQDYLAKLDKQFPDSDYQAETLKVSGDNAFTLDRWAEAAANYQEYLDNFPDDKERDRIGLKLAECYWELRDYEKAAVVLQEVSNTTESAELSFRARLWRARVHVRMGDYEVASLLADELNSEAEIYNTGNVSASGQIQVIKAENLVAQGREEEAAPLLENMPDEWVKDSMVLARSSEIRGNLYMARGMLEEAKTQFQNSLRNKDVLDDENHCRLLKESLEAYLNAENALPDASGERVPRLKLLQANSMLFGFQRPGEAARLFVEAAVDTAADSTVTPRALFGAVVTYRDYLDKPDSADFFSRLLVEGFPESPQAFEVEQGRQGDLLEFLLAQKQRRQQDALAALSDEERAELNEVSDLLDYASSVGRRKTGIRRRQVYLARRDNLVIAPSDEMKAADEARRGPPPSEALTVPAPYEADRPSSLSGQSPTTRMLGAGVDSLGVPVGAGADSLLTRPGGQTGVASDQAKPQPMTGAEEDRKKKEAEKKKPKKFDLR